jgi:TatD DNase family protein
MLIDAHAHLDRYEDKLDSVLEEINQNKIFTLSNSMDLPSYRRNLEIAERCKLILPCFGVHPWNATEYTDHLEDLRDAVGQTPLLGEIGLDLYSAEDVDQFPAQRKVLEFFLAAAKEQKKIVNLHTRGAEKQVLQLLKEFDIQRGIIHWYSGPLDIFQELVVRGLYFTIGAEVLYSDHIRTIAKKLPEEQLLTETDNPGGQKWLTGEPGMPLLIKDVILTLAKLRETTPHIIIQRVQGNFVRLIQDDLWLNETYLKVSGL